MSVALRKDDWISPEEYLAGELLSEVRHEYLGGYVYAMAGASEDHNVIAGNIFAAIHGHLRGNRCRVFINDMKARIPSVGRDVFYYPDVMVTCGPRGEPKYFKRDPIVIFEVLSRDTASTDRREKFFAYTSLPTLESYVLVEQRKIEVTAFHRAGEGWRTEVLSTADAVLELPRIEFKLPLASIYEEVF